MGETTSNSAGANHPGSGNMLNIASILKLLEFGLALSGLGVVASVEEAKFNAEFHIYILVFSTVIVFTLLDLMFRLSGFCKRVPVFINHSIVLGLLCVLGWIVVLVTSAQVIRLYSDVRDTNRNLKSSVHDRLAAGGSLGIILSFIFLFEAIYLLAYNATGSNDGSHPKDSGNTSAQNTTTVY